MFFFFQAEDGIRDYEVTGVQTCALPIYLGEDSKNTVAIYSTNNTAKNTLFSSGVFKLKQGRHLEQNDRGKALIYEVFAQKNNLKIGDRVELNLINTSGKKTET